MSAVRPAPAEAHRVSGRRHPYLFLCCALSMMAAQQLHAGFVAPYAPENFVLLSSGGTHPNGFAQFPDANTLILTGPNDGDAELPGTTDLVSVAVAAGMFQFDFLYSSLDAAGWDYAGYIVGSQFVAIADTDGEYGSVAVPVLSGETFGFRVGTLDNQGEPGVLNVTNFSMSAPEPASAAYFGIGMLVLVAGCHRRWFRRGAAMALVAAVCFPAIAPAQQVFYSGTNVTGSLSLSGVVSVRQQLQTFGFMALRLSAPEVLKPPQPLLRPPAIGSPTGAVQTLHSQVAARTTLSTTMLTTAAVAPIKSLAMAQDPNMTGFNALSHRDQRLANNGNQFSIEPPNPSIAVGNGYVLEGVNDAVQIYTTAGTPALSAVVSSNQLFGLAPAINRTTGANGVYLTDMRVYFDPVMGRWLVVQRSQDNDVLGNSLNSSHLYIAVSQTADPTGQYNIYVMNTTNANHPGCPCVADYPQIGSDQYGFHIAWNEFYYAQATNSYYFVDAAILAISKASLAAGATAPTAVQFLLPYTTGYEFAIQPAMTPPGASNFVASGGLEYLASTAASAGSHVALWAIYNTSSLVTANPNLTLTRIMVPTLSYTFPDVANQPPGPTPYGSSLIPPGGLESLDGGDVRVQSLLYAAGRLFLALQTGVTDENGRTMVGGAYVVLSPTYRSGILAAQVLNQGYLVVNGTHLLRPALAVNAQGNGAIAVTLVGASWYPTAAIIPFQTFTAPSTIQVAAQGTLPEDGFSGYPSGGGYGIARWGDYNGAVVDSDGSIWTVAEYIGSFPRTDFANWNTYITRKVF